MNEQDIYNGITDLSDDVLWETETMYKDWRGRVRVRLIVAILGIVVITGAFLVRFAFTEGPSRAAAACAVVQAEYPEMAPYPDEMKFMQEQRYEEFEAVHEAWWQDIRAQQAPTGYADDLEGFFSATIGRFLSDAQGENRVCSPLNIYMALAMLAEVTDGESRQQVLDLLDKGDMEALRAQANALWNANYRDDGATKSLLAGSLWMNEDLSYNEDTVQTLADTYYASSYQGEMGSPEFDEALQGWLNEQTGGLLNEQAADLTLSPETVLALATTVYFKAKWDGEFLPENTAQDVFHGANGDVTCDFMHQENLFTTYCWGERFTALEHPLANAGSMWYILPDEGYSVDDLLRDEQTLEFIQTGKGWESKENICANLSVPKFDVASQMDLKDGLKELGVTDVFAAEEADFSALTDTEPVWLDKVQHDARVVIDETGVEAAAYTAMIMLGGAPLGSKVDFVLDRPFLFVITGLDGLPLFVGVVNQP